MAETVIPLERMGTSKKRKRQAPRGRNVVDSAVAEVEALVGPGPLRHDLLIEYLHLINDRYKQLGAPHLAALARLLGLSQTEVYEVATFYHHFDVVKEGEDGTLAAPAALTVRVCDGLSCEMAGAGALLERLPHLLGPGVKVIAAPCVGRCEQAPVAVVHQKPVPNASLEAVQQAVKARSAVRPTRGLYRFRCLPGTGRLRAAARVYRAPPRCRDGHQDPGGFGAARARRRGVSGRPKVAHRAGEPRLD